jgi:hypothetical protein
VADDKLHKNFPQLLRELHQNGTVSYKKAGGHSLSPYNLRPSCAILRPHAPPWALRLGACLLAGLHWG